MSASTAAASAGPRVGGAVPPAAPRRRRGSALRYVDSSPGGGGPDDGTTASATSPRGEFTLLRPHLQFSEVDLQELFGGDGVPGGAPAAGRIHEALEERWRADAEEKQRGRNHRPVPEETPASDDPRESPFFFASVVRESEVPAAESSATSGGADPPSGPPRPSSEPSSPAALLPPWLLHVSPRSAPLELQRLRSDLRPHLSAREAGTVVDAVRAAASGDPRKVAGAADFCSILVNSLELTGVSVLCAAAFHYCSLVAVREREAEEASGLGGGEECGVEEEECLRQAGADAKFLCALAGSGIEEYGAHAVKIALDSAKLKSMETLAASVVRSNESGLPSGRRSTGRRLHGPDARNLRSLLLSVNDEGDWRALAVRSAACLYRLRGLASHRSALLECGDGYGGVDPGRVTPDESRASHEALHIYAPLAARLGMFRLKTELEDAAFRALYPRSHGAVFAMGRGDDTVSEGMRAVLSDVTCQIKRIVQDDCEFMDNIESVSVTARVKEPYSVWRKMLKISKETNQSVRDMSILDVPDAVATRVVFKARKLADDESDDATRDREQRMCYHLLDLCAAAWPDHGESGTRLKDYVRNPKPNGYRSLHYSTTKRWRGQSWPFEVQIRSREMHKNAEFGVAAHWNYKREGIDGGDGRIDKTSEAYLRSADDWRRREASARAKRGAHQPPSSAAYTTAGGGGYDSESDDNSPARYIEEEIRRQRKRDRETRLAPYLEALSGDMTDMTREAVYVFVSVQPPTTDGSASPSSSSPATLAEGTVLSLPHGSRVLDAVRVAEKWSAFLEDGRGNLYDGRGAFAALRNGFRTSAMGTERLDNGDVVSIVPTDSLVSAKWSGSTGGAGSSFQ